MPAQSLLPLGPASTTACRFTLDTGSNVQLGRTIWKNVAKPTNNTNWMIIINPGPSLNKKLWEERLTILVILDPFGQRFGRGSGVRCVMNTNARLSSWKWDELKVIPSNLPSVRVWENEQSPQKGMSQHVEGYPLTDLPRSLVSWCWWNADGMKPKAAVVVIWPGFWTKFEVFQVMGQGFRKSKVNWFMLGSKSLQPGKLTWNLKTT